MTRRPPFDLADRKSGGAVSQGLFRALCILGLFLMIGCNRVFYYPNRVRYGSPEELNLRYESVRFTTADSSQLHAYWCPAVGTNREGDSNRSEDTGPAEPGSVTVKHEPMSNRAKGTVLHLHGNAGNITGHFQHVAWLPEQGWNVLTFDYRGYGQSQGRMSRAGSIEDANAALDYLLRRSDVDPERIVVFGQSLGGAIGIVLTATRPEIRGLATDGAFDSYRRIVAWHVRRNPLLFLAAWWYPLGLSREFDPIDYVARISPRPLFIMHGTADRVVDPRMASRLYEAAGETRKIWLADGADHYGAMQDQPEEARPRLLAFFDQCVQRTRQGSAK